MKRVLFVSKAVDPPWNDSSKNLVRDLAGHLEAFSGDLMVGQAKARGARVQTQLRGHGDVEGRWVYRSAGGFAPGLATQLQTLGYLLREGRSDLWHFFFAPNPRSSEAGRWLSRLRRRPTVQTVCSAPRRDVNAASLAFADVTVVLSKATEARFVADGLAPEKVRRIPPAVPRLEPLALELRDRWRARLGSGERPLVVYPGDLEFGGGAELCLAAVESGLDVDLVMACRTKTPEARVAEATLRERAAPLGERVRWIGETSEILSVLGCADVVVLPSADLYAKMDYPLAILEAMSMGVPVVVAEGSPAGELVEAGGAIGVDAAAGGAALADAVSQALGDGNAGQRGRELVLDAHTPEKMARAYESLYEELLR